MNESHLPPSLTQWLARILEPEYQNVPKTYNDVVQLISVYPSLRPKTDVFTHESGHSELLLCIYGNIPARVANTVYRIPIEFWIPKQYPSGAPMAYVRPTSQMVIHPGNHVDINGMCYHPYLSYWADNLSSSLVELVSVLSDVFSREPPVYAKPLPQEPAPAYELHTSQESASSSSTNKGRRHDEHEQLPALPPKPAELVQQFSTQQPMRLQNSTNFGVNAGTSFLPTGSRSVSPPPPPPPPPLPSSYRHPGNFVSSANHRDQQPLSQPTDQFAHTYQSSSPLQQSQPQESSSIMDSEVEIASNTSQPPRPPNPERVQAKSDLEKSFQSVILAHLKNEINVDETALSSAEQTLNWIDQAHKREQLEIDRLITSSENNINILKDRIANAKAVIQDATTRVIPHIDELVSTEAVVYNQLYSLVAEDRAIDDSLYVLDKALDHDIIGLDTFMKHTRALAREQFLKRALILKISSEIGL